VAPYAMRLTLLAMLKDAKPMPNSIRNNGRYSMHEFKQVVSHIVVMQVLVIAVLVDRWASET
jgi:hypothetical protein